MSDPNRDNRTPLERLMRMGWDALDNARRAEPLTLDKMAQNARDALETARKGLMDETALKEFRFIAPIDNAATANVDMELSVGDAGVSALAGSDNTLIDAHLKYLGSLSFGVTGDAQRHVFLRQSTPITVGWVNPIHWATRPRWDVGLSPRLPLDLRVQGGVGDAELNLSGLDLQSLRVDGNIGPINITLPARGNTFTGTVRGGAGPIALNIPHGANAIVNMRGAVGGFVLTIASGAQVQVKMAGGVGHVDMLPGFHKIEATAPGLPNTGTWQTPGYETATRRVLVNIADGMVGNISVRVMRE